MKNNTGIVYLLHFETPYKHAKHYIGFTQNLINRLAEHKAGRGARLMEVIKEAKIDFFLSKVWVGDRNLERKLKNRKDSPSLCPLCRGASC